MNNRSREVLPVIWLLFRCREVSEVSCHTMGIVDDYYAACAIMDK